MDVRPKESRENQKSNIRARRQHSTVPVGALLRHANVQVRQHYGEADVWVERT